MELRSEDGPDPYWLLWWSRDARCRSRLMKTIKKKMFAREIWGPDLLAARKIEDSRSEKIYGGP